METANIEAKEGESVADKGGAGRAVSAQIDALVAALGMSRGTAAKTAQRWRDHAREVGDAVPWGEGIAALAAWFERNFPLVSGAARPRWLVAFYEAQAAQAILGENPAQNPAQNTAIPAKIEPESLADLILGEITKVKTNLEGASGITDVLSRAKVESELRNQLIGLTKQHREAEDRNLAVRALVASSLEEERRADDAIMQAFEACIKKVFSERRDQMKAVVGDEALYLDLLKKLFSLARIEFQKLGESDLE